MRDAQQRLGAVNVRDYVAEEIRAQLARKRISAREAARRLGWHQSQIHRRMTGTQAIGVEHLHQLACLLDIPVEQFFPPRTLPGISS
jgi:transcriptional regulator with XRE-family HTH domain